MIDARAPRFNQTVVGIIALAGALFGWPLLWALMGLQLFLGQQAQRWELLMAAATISMVPTVILVLALQKYLVKGIALSGLGGR